VVRVWKATVGQLRGRAVVEVKATATSEYYASKTWSERHHQVRESLWEGEKRLQLVGGSVIRVLRVSDATVEAMMEGGERYRDTKGRTKKLNRLDSVICQSKRDALL
jgi:hypothetical protein